MEGRQLEGRSYNHIAFKIDEKDYDKLLKKIKNYGLEIKDSRKRIDADSESIYFYDFDNHLFELHTGTLNNRLKEYHDILKKDEKD
jgi:primosomal protein N''